MIKIGYVIGQYPPDQRARREEVAKSYGSGDMMVEIISVEETPYVHGLTPAEVRHVAPAFHRAFQKAEAQGCHGVVPLGMLDLGVEGGKSLVNIPVVGPCEASLHVASLLGQRFGLMVYHKALLPLIQSLVQFYGMRDWVVGYGTSGVDLPDIAANRDQMIETFLAEARRLIDNCGADTIIPMGITQCPVHMDPRWLESELGVPVVEGIGAPIQMAATLARLGLKQSRLRWPLSQMQA